MSLKNLENEKLINLNLISKKIKSIKEKNIKNEITKYKISIHIEVNFEILGDNKKNTFKISKSGDYNVSSQYSQTLTNEKKLVELLTDSMGDQIIFQLTNKINDL